MLPQTLGIHGGLLSAFRVTVKDRRFPRLAFGRLQLGLKEAGGLMVWTGSGLPRDLSKYRQRKRCDPIRFSAGFDHHKNFRFIGSVGTCLFAAISH